MRKVLSISLVSPRNAFAHSDIRHFVKMYRLGIVSPRKPFQLQRKRRNVKLYRLGIVSHLTCYLALGCGDRRRSDYSSVTRKSQPDKEMCPSDLLSLGAPLCALCGARGAALRGAHNCRVGGLFECSLPGIGIFRCSRRSNRVLATRVKKS
jgi:hypothetical protein